MVLIDSVGFLTEAIYMVGSNPGLWSIPGMEDCDVFRLRDPLHPAEGSIALGFLGSVAIMRDDGYCVGLHEVSAEDMHAGSSNGDGHIKRLDPQFLIENVLKLQAAAEENVYIRMAVGKDLLLEVELLSILLPVPIIVIYVVIHGFM